VQERTGAAWQALSRSSRSSAARSAWQLDREWKFVEAPAGRNQTRGSRLGCQGLAWLLAVGCWRPAELAAVASLASLAWTERDASAYRYRICKGRRDGVSCKRREGETVMRSARNSGRGVGSLGVAATSFDPGRRQMAVQYTVILPKSASQSVPADPRRQSLDLSRRNRSRPVLISGERDGKQELWLGQPPKGPDGCRCK
jgi:hypothetical protein